ncbi:hypothetical protein ACFKHW_37415 [Bradyrhizobium lupini]|uniref:hypothetical protein n=1 Tax=Rhizobium lupini TaxID=136996 RepID=UPI00366D028A
MLAQRGQLWPAAPVRDSVEVEPARHTCQQGVREGRPVGEQEPCRLDHAFELVVTFDHLSPSELPQGRTHGVVHRHAFHCDPKRREGAGKAGIHERHQLVHAIGLRRQRIKADAPFGIPGFEPSRDRHGFRQHIALVRYKCRRLVSRIDPGV